MRTVEPDAHEQGPASCKQAPLLVNVKPGEGCDDRQAQESLATFLAHP
jgi:hypothetical protein